MLSYQTQLHLIANSIKLLQAFVKALQRSVAAFAKSKQIQTNALTIFSLMFQ